MKNLVFITGNEKKAEYLSKYLNHPVSHIKLDLEEIQSTSIKQITIHKVKQAFKQTNKPVIVEDVSLEFEALGSLPGPFIKFFIKNTSFENICSMIPNGQTRNATARCIIAYFDGEQLKTFEGKLEGKIATKPSGENGFGWDKIFIPKGFDTTRAGLSPEDDKKTYLQLKPFEELKEFLTKNIY